MKKFTDRTEALIGKSGIDKLKNTHVAVFGLGGVGGSATEALVRAGVGELTLVDKDVVDITNINRQAVATFNSIGMDKVDAAADRFYSINPNVVLNLKKMFFLEEEKEKLDFSKFDYIVDAIDTITAKLALVEIANKYNIPIISAMGAGNKMNPTEFEVADIYKTSVCPLAKVMRKELKQRGIKSLKVVYSKEIPITNNRPPASISFVPPVVGMIIASEVVKDLIK